MTHLHLPIKGKLVSIWMKAAGSGLFTALCAGLRHLQADTVASTMFVWIVQNVIVEGPYMDSLYGVLFRSMAYE